MDVTTRHKASCASAIAIRYGISNRPYVCLLSVTHRYCVKRGNRRMQFLPSSSPVPLAFWRQEWLMGDNPVQIKFECKEIDPCENSRAVHISPHNTETETDSKVRSIKAHRKSTFGFSRWCDIPNFTKIWFRYPNLSFFRRNVNQKTIESMLQNFIVWWKNFVNTSSGNVVAHQLLIECTKILAKDDPIPVKIGPKGTDLNGKDARLMFYTRHAVC